MPIQEKTMWKPKEKAIWSRAAKKSSIKAKVKVNRQNIGRITFYNCFINVILGSPASQNELIPRLFSPPAV